jgi:DNA-binding HxlR family transcriptional regulator
MTPSRHQLQHTCQALALPALIRLVSEIDDHGTIPPRALARSLTALSTHQIRQAIERADALGVLHRSRVGLGLTAAGRDLADFYDAAARWARRHNYPEPVSNFPERIRRVLLLLSDPAAPQPPLHSGDAATGLRQVHRLLTSWIEAHQQQAHQSAYGVAA